MNGPALQILKSYVHFSRWGFAAAALFYLLMITSIGFGWPWSLIEDDGLQQLSKAVQNPFYFMAFPLLFTGVIASRLASTQYYSLAFLAPAYRREHLKTAIGTVLVLCWIPPLAGDLSNVYVTFSVLVAITGVVLMYREFAPAYLKYSLPFFCVVLFLLLASQRWQPRWQPPAWLSGLLVIIGVALIISFIRQFLSGHEYNTTSESSAWWGPGPQGVWIRTSPYSLNSSYFDSYPQLFDRRERRIQHRIDRYRDSNRDEHAMGVLVAFATGEEQQSWNYLVGAAVIFLFLIVLLLLVDKVDAPLISFLCFVGPIPALLIGVIARVFYPSWSIGNVWLRTPFADKQAVIRTMCERRMSAGLLVLFLALLMAALATDSLFLFPDDPTLKTFKLIMRPASVSFLFAAIGSMCHVIALGMLFDRLGRGGAALATAVLLIAGWLCILEAQGYFIAKEFQVAFLPASTMVLVTGIGLLCVVFVWWYKGYFKRRDW